MSNGIPDPPPEMTTFGLALDTNGDIWQYQGSNGMVKIGSLTPALPPPNNTVPPSLTFVTGTGAVGSQIACNPGTWVPTGTYARQWFSEGVAIPGANSPSYTAQASDVGNMITCVVTATNESGSGAATSNALGPITE